MTHIVNATTQRTLAHCAENARGAWRQFMGLMGQRGLPESGGLILPSTRGVHTHFMRFAIDVVFYDKAGVIVGIEHTLRPWRFSAYHFAAVGAIELPSGTLLATGTEAGHVIAFTPAN
jgi:uncharacterized protein